MSDGAGLRRPCGWRASLVGLAALLTMLSADLLQCKAGWAGSAAVGLGAPQLPATPMPIGRIHRDATGKLVPIESDAETPPELPPRRDQRPACAALGAGPQVRLISISESIGLNTQHSLAEMQLIGHGAPAHPVGLYRASLRRDFELEFGRGELRDADGKPHACIWVKQVLVKIGFLPRTVLIAHEYRVGSCAYNAILSHEMRHAQIDDAVLGDYLPKLRDRLRRAAAEAGTAGTVPPAAVEKRKAELTARVRGVLDEAAAELERRRREAQMMIDTPSEYRRVAMSCPDHLRPRG